MASAATPGDLSTADLRRVMQAVDPAAHQGSGTFLPDSVLQCLSAVIGCDLVTFQVMDARCRSATVQEAGPACEGDTPGPAPDQGSTDLFWSGFWESRFCSYPNRTGDHDSVIRLSDFYTREALARTLLGEYHALVGGGQEVILPLPPDGVLDRRMLLFRSDGRDFSEREVLLLRLLRPHLLSLHLRQRRRAAGIPDLTARQLQALRLIAAGCTNAQVARALGISEATVRKHLENAFARLDVGTRTAAVAKVLPFMSAG